MTWLETYRGCVSRWEVDHVDHFTVAYYFQRFEDATQALLAALGLDGASLAAQGRRVVTTHAHVRYLRELRVADVLHIRSGVTGEDGAAFLVGHQLFDSGDGALTTTVEQRLAVVDASRQRPLPPGPAARMAPRRVAWDVADSARPDARSIEPPAVDDGRCLDSALETVKPWELDADGCAAFPAFIHRFSGANGQLLASLGVTPAYMRAERRGFSTFEFRMTFPGSLRAGEIARVRSGLVRVGNTSLSMLHRMLRGSSDEVVATLQQSGVLLDVAARRPAPLPDTLRKRAQELLAVTARG